MDKNYRVCRERLDWIRDRTILVFLQSRIPVEERRGGAEKQSQHR